MVRNHSITVSLMSLATGCMLLAAPPLLAQVEFGGLYGGVGDGEGTPLPGVSLSLAGPGATQLQVSDDQGNFRFPRLDPGLYSLEAELDGFSPLEHTNIDIRAGRNTTLVLQVTAAVQDAITVTGEAPLLDERKLSQGALMTAVDVERIPTAGDVHSVLNQAPGVMVDRLDVGGSRAPLAVEATAPGVRNSQNDFMIDGVQMTDMGIEGGVAAFFDMEQADQVEISTGGNDISKATAGVAVNLVTKRGTNEFRGSARYFVIDEDLFWFFKQSSPDLDPDDFPPEQEMNIEATQINRIENYGLEGGGPIIRNRLWFWGSHMRSDYSATAVGGFPRDDVITASALKLNAQLSDANSLLTSWNNSLKENDGDPSFSFSPAASRRLGGGSGIPLLKIQDSHVFSSNLFLTGTFARFDSDWSLIANGCFLAGGCETATEALLDSNGVWQNNFLSGSTDRPTTEWKIDGSYFFGAGQISHELKFGGRFREFESQTSFHWPGGRDIAHAAADVFGLPPDSGLGFFWAQRGAGPPISTDYTSIWVQDTLTAGKWTANAGLRYDLQRGENQPHDIPANPAFPDLLPAVAFEGNDGGFDWESISPRLGVTYALGAERQTLLRVSYSRFASALGASHIGHINPLSEAYVTFLFVDFNGNQMWDGREEPYDPVFFLGFDPANPTDLSSPNRTDPNLDPELTDEIVLGVDHALRPELVVGLHITWRNTADILEYRDFLRECETTDCASGPIRLARREDYLFLGSREVTQPNGQPYSVDIYDLDPRFQFTGGSLQVNGDREVDYLGASLTVTKRLSNQWMLRGFINYGKPEWDIPESFFQFDDPNDLDAFDTTGFDNDGDLFAEGAGRFRRLIMHSTWSFNVNGMYQVAPDRAWGFNVAGNIYGREGYPVPLETLASDSSAFNIQAMASADDFRYDDLYTVDLRIEKEFSAWGKSSFTLSADVFNALNEGTVLERETNVNVPSFVLETLSPRIWRLGVRFNWR